MYIKIYTKANQHIDTVYEIGKPQTTHTLNGVGKFTCTIPINNIKVTENLVKFMNHVYFYDDNDNLKFGGVLVDRSFNMPDITIGCYGWAFLFQKKRMTAKSYSNASYSSYMNTIFNEYMLNYGSMTGFFKNGVTTATDTTRTTRIVTDTDFVWDKATEWNEDVNGMIGFTDDHIFTFGYDKYQRQMWYAKWEFDEASNILELPTSFNNLLTFPSVSQSATEMANRMYGEVSGQNESGADVTLTALKLDNNSIAAYGVLDGVASINDSVVLQATVNDKTQAELDRVGLPSSNMDISISDSILAPLDEIKVGHKITVFIEPYLNFKAETTILEISRNYEENVAKLTVGKTLYRQNVPKTVNYK